METSTLFRSGKHTIALIGNYLPRRCGIATFSTDLLEAIAAEASTSDCFTVAMDDIPTGYDYPERVRFVIKDKHLADYRLAAEFVNVNQADVVVLQHEYGIFGGVYGEHILSLLRDLRVPLVTTLHTVLAKPGEERKGLLQEICELSARVIVMSKKALGLLNDVYGISGDKVRIIPHGIHDVPFVDPNYYKDQFGVEGKKVIFNFGLLSPRKGLENIIDALPAIVKKHPDVVCIFLGETHPNILRKYGEAYRVSLQRRARKLGVEKHLIFHNRFVELKELMEFMGAADIFIMPYLGEDQITSGTLAYAMGAGKATIATPFWHAKELLDGQRGRLIPFGDPKALAKQVVDLFDNETSRHAMRKRAYSYCRDMVWKEVARSYLQVFDEAEEEWQRHPRLLSHSRLANEKEVELPRINIEHLRRLTDDVGIVRHARFIVPAREHGYALNDNARALMVALMAQQLIPDDSFLKDLECVYMGFLWHAFSEKTNRFKSIMNFDRHWQEGIGSEDSQGRALWALGTVIGSEPYSPLCDVAMGVFKKTVNNLLEFSAPRSWAFGLIGIQNYLKRFGGDREVCGIQKRVAVLLLREYENNASSKWPWINDQLTYDNGKIPQALIASGQLLNNEKMKNAGLKCLDWLVGIQFDAANVFEAVGNHGWYPKGGNKARFDQQPIEAQSILEACLAAYRATGKKKWDDAARRCLDWFLGHNNMNVNLYDYNSGGCCDGLGADGANPNQGAEATLAWLLSLLMMYNHQNYKEKLKVRKRDIKITKDNIKRKTSKGRNVKQGRR